MQSKPTQAFDRREFMTASAGAAVAAVVAASASSCGGPSDPDTLDAVGDAGPHVDEWVKSVCRFCGTGCGVMLGVRNRELVAVRPDQKHPTTKGLNCVKALMLPKVVSAPDRLTTPKIRKDGELVDASWEEAMDLVCDRFAAAIREHGPDSVAYYGSGQCMTEESYLANRIFKGGIGTNNVEGNPRLCMASAVGGYVTTFGKDEPMGCYDDIEAAQVFLLVGSNTAECHPVLFDRILAEQRTGRGVTVIAIDPRESPIGRHTDLYLQPKPGYDLAVFHAMAQVILDEGMQDDAFIGEHVQFRVMRDGEPAQVGFEEYKAFLDAEFTPEQAEEVTGVPAGDIRRAARLFAGGPTVSLWTMGLNQRVTGVWCNNLIHNLHLITGQIGKPGMTPFSLTGQPNACGGVRDTGTLCHLLPYGRSVAKAEDRADMEELWGAKPGTIPDKPGLHTVAMFDALAEDRIQAMLITTTNPGQSMPHASKYRDAMGKPRPNKPFIVCLDIFPTRTTELADVVLPAAMWAEKTGVFGMSERRYQLHPQVTDPPGEARSDFDVLVDLARGLEERGLIPEGYVGDKFPSTDACWDEIRLASKDTSYDFMGMTRERLRRERGLRWPCPDEDHPGTARRFVKGDDPTLDRVEKYADPDLEPGQLKFYAAPDHRAIVWLRPLKPPAEPPDEEYPIVLSTGRVLEHWHSGTMTMRADELRRSYRECYVEIHPDDAEPRGIVTGDDVRLTSRRGEATVKARVVGRPQPGMVFVPWHWEDDPSLINLVTINAFDPGSKQPEFKICAVRMEKA